MAFGTTASLGSTTVPFTEVADWAWEVVVAIKSEIVKAATDNCLDIEVSTNPPGMMAE
jgi:hypothetical protein